MLVEHLHAMRNEERAIGMEFEALLEVMEQTELLESALEEFGYSQQISRIFNLDKIGSSLGFETDLDTSELPLVIDSPIDDENTQGALVALHAAMEKIGTKGIKKATETITAHDKQLAKLTEEYKILKTALNDYASGSFDKDKLNITNISIADYNMMNKTLKQAMGYIHSSTHHSRIEKIKKLNAWFADLGKHADEYNKLVDEYTRWCDDKLNIDPTKQKVTMDMVRKHINVMYYNDLIDSIKTVRLTDSPWFKNYKQAITTGMDVSGRILRLTDIWEADKLQTSKNFGFWRANRIKSKYSSKFKQPLSWLLRMSVIDLVYYNNHLGICMSYVYGCLAPLLSVMDTCHNKKK